MSKKRKHKIELEKINRELKIKKQEKFIAKLQKQGKIKDKKDARTLTSQKSQSTGPRFGKALLDNGIGKARNLLLCKGNWARRTVNVVSEKYTTQVCSKCDQFTGFVFDVTLQSDQICGLRQLGVRNWVCSNCKFEHNRDQCSGQNIYRVIPGLTLLDSVPGLRHLFAEMREQEKMIRLEQAKPCRSPNRD